MDLETNRDEFIEQVIVPACREYYEYPCALRFNDIANLFIFNSAEECAQETATRMWRRDVKTKRGMENILPFSAAHWDEEGVCALLVARGELGLLDYIDNHYHWGLERWIKDYDHDASLIEACEESVNLSTEFPVMLDILYADLDVASGMQAWRQGVPIEDVIA